MFECFGAIKAHQGQTETHTSKNLPTNIKILCEYARPTHREGVEVFSGMTPKKRKENEKKTA